MMSVASNRSSTAAAILAGGRARRLDGRDKSRLIVEGRPIIHRQLDVLQALAGEIVIIAPERDRFADVDVPVHADVVPGLGALGGLLTALSVTRASRVVVVGCDMPFLERALLERLVELAGGEDVDGAWVRSHRGVEPLCACYRHEARVAVERSIREGRLKASDLATVLRMAEVSGPELAAFGPPDRLLANVNTPEDYLRVDPNGRFPDNR
jgi:molybdopterin-guanine dinucleotide biosynthesis protein A